MMRLVRLNLPMSAVLETEHVCVDWCLTLDWSFSPPGPGHSHIPLAGRANTGMSPAQK